MTMIVRLDIVAPITEARRLRATLAQAEQSNGVAAEAHRALVVAVWEAEVELDRCAQTLGWLRKEHEESLWKRIWREVKR